MSTLRYQPWALLNQLNRAFEASNAGKQEPDTTEAYSWSPPVDVAEYGGYYLLRADLPGVDLTKVEIGMEDGVLTIKGERQREPADEGCTYQRTERVSGTFFRRFSLPDTVDIERVSARGSQGVLEITIPKVEKATPRKIAIEVTH